jgi:hypothetical protein
MAIFNSYVSLPEGIRLVGKSTRNGDYSIGLRENLQETMVFTIKFEYGGL